MGDPTLKSEGISWTVYSYHLWKLQNGSKQENIKPKYMYIFFFVEEFRKAVKLGVP